MTHHLDNLEDTAVASKKMDVDPCHAYIQEALRDERCVLQEMSIKQIVRDRRLQARDQQCGSPDHVTHACALSEQMVAMGPQATLAPIVVFLVDAIYYVADGFHRLTAYDKLRRSSAPAYVVSGAWADAIKFAAMANQRNTAKPRSRDDVRKAIRLMLEEDEFWKWSDKNIGAHIGCSHGVIGRVRAEVKEELGREMPDFVLSSSGMETARGFGGKRFCLSDRKITEIKKSDGRTVYKTSVQGREISSTNRGRVVERSRAAVEELRDSQRAADGTVRPEGISVNHIHSISDFLARLGIACETVRIDGVSRSSWPECRTTKDWIFSRCSIGGGQSLYEAAFQVLLADKIDGRGRNLAVVCHSRLAPPEVIELIRRHFSIEFLSPEELADRIKSGDSGCVAMGIVA